jgi:hypothetical protein
MTKNPSIHDLARGTGPVTTLSLEDQEPLPPPFDKLDEEPRFKPLAETAKQKFVVLDDTIAVNIPKPKNKEEEDRLVYPRSRTQTKAPNTFHIRTLFTFCPTTTRPKQACACTPDRQR